MRNPFKSCSLVIIVYAIKLTEKVTEIDGFFFFNGLIILLLLLSLGGASFGLLLSGGGARSNSHRGDFSDTLVCELVELLALECLDSGLNLLFIDFAIDRFEVRGQIILVDVLLSSQYQ